MSIKNMPYQIIYSLNVLLFVYIMTMLQFIIFCFVSFSKEPGKDRELNLICSTVLLSYMICSCTFLIFKNHLNKSKQTKCICLWISFGLFLFSIIQCSRGILMYTWKQWIMDGNGYALIMMVISGIISYIYLALIFAKASYTISEFTDIWDVDKVTSKSNLPYYIMWCVNSQKGFVSVLYSIHVIPRYYL